MKLSEVVSGRDYALRSPSERNRAKVARVRVTGPPRSGKVPYLLRALDGAKLPKGSGLPGGEAIPGALLGEWLPYLRSEVGRADLGEERAAELLRLDSERVAREAPPAEPREGPSAGARASEAAPPLPTPGRAPPEAPGGSEAASPASAPDGADRSLRAAEEAIGRTEGRTEPGKRVSLSAESFAFLLFLADIGIGEVERLAREPGPTRDLARETLRTLSARKGVPPPVF